MFDLSDRIHRRFGGRHREVQEEVIVRVQKIEDGDLILFRCVRFDDTRRDLADKQRCRRFVAVVHFVAHLSRLRDHGLEVNRPINLQRLLHDRIERFLHPFQMLDDIIAICTETKNIAESLIHRTIRKVALRFILHDKDRH